MQEEKCGMNGNSIKLNWDYQDQAPRFTTMTSFAATKIGRDDHISTVIVDCVNTITFFQNYVYITNIAKGEKKYIGFMVLMEA